MKTIILQICLCFLIFVSSNAQNKLTFEKSTFWDKKICLEIPLTTENSPNYAFYSKVWKVNLINDTLGQVFDEIEFGASYSLVIFNNKLKNQVNIGFGNGNYLSGSGSFLIFENFALGLQMQYDFSNSFHNLLNIGANFQLRSSSGIRPLMDFYRLEYQIKYSINNSISFGFLYDQVIFSEKKSNYRTTYSKHLWFGVLIEFSAISRNLITQVAGGADLIDYIDSGINDENKKIKEFAKILIKYSF